MRSILACAVLLAVTAPSYANQCPSLWKQIDAKLPAAQISAANRAMVTQLRKQGEALHKSGDHTKSEAALKQALSLLR
jgi:hypothetical protein